MYGDRRYPDFINGMHDFLRMAETNKPPNGFISCLSSVCKNTQDYSTSKTIHVHLLQHVSCPVIIVGPSTEKEGL